MKKIRFFLALLPLAFFVLTPSCQKDSGIVPEKQNQNSTGSVMAETPPFNIEVILRGNGQEFGYVKFRQDVGPDKIITLDIWVRDLEPNHEYELQRAADPFDGTCTSTTWLTLGKGLIPQSILTDDKGTGSENLWRDITAVASGSHFDIHFQVIDKTTNAVVLNSDCYDYVVR